jgi:phosphatidylglycerophosphatase A
MIDFIALEISSVFGLCKKTKAPGTIASFVALIFSFLAYYFLSRTIYLLLFFIFLFLAFWAIKTIHKKSEAGDYPWIGIDEFVGMWLANFFLFEFNFNFTEAIIYSLISFIIFRIIDIFKFIPPLHTINTNKRQGTFMVLFDDIIGSLYTYFIMLTLLSFYNLNFLYTSLLVLFPSMIANMTPVLLKTKYWDTPINEKLFGKNKTWRGFLGAIVFGTLTYFILVKFELVNSVNSVGLILFIGFLFSFGAIGGDLIKSFFKRRIGIGPGESWAPWDQIDYVLGMIFLTYFIYEYSFGQIVFMLILGGTISAFSHRLGFLLKMNTAKQ